MTIVEELSPGAVLHGVYRILSTLGRGGFGVTYLAEDLAAHQHVAIKEFFPEFCALRHEGGGVYPKPGRDQDFAAHRNSFRAEAEALSRFDHPNIVHVLGRFDANNTSYFVMEFVEGEVLEKVCKRSGSLQGEAVMLIAENLVEVAKTIHDQDLLHRDIKPENIILGKLNATRPTRLTGIPHDVQMRFGKPVVLDFGAVRQASAAGRTMTGIVTPGFGAPEQSIERGHQDARTDIYGIGATLYYCLAGEAPPPATTRQNEDLLIPAQQRFVGRAPQSFLRAIDRALQLRPEYRPSDARAFRAELFDDLNIEGWSQPGRVYSQPGPSEFLRSPSLQPSAPAPPARSGVVGAVVGIFVVVSAIAGGGYWMLYGPGAANSVRADSHMDFLLRRIEAARSAHNELSTLQTTRAEFAAAGMRNSARDVDGRIAELTQQAQADRANALGLFEGLVQFARNDPEEFQRIAAGMEADARADGRLDTVRRLSALRELVIAAQRASAIDEDEFLSFWNREVELAQ